MSSLARAKSFGIPKVQRWLSWMNMSAVKTLLRCCNWRSQISIHLGKYKCSQGGHAIKILCCAMLHTSIQDNDCLDAFRCRLDWAYWALGFHWQFVNLLRTNVASLVGGDWNMTCIFQSIGNVIIPIDFHIFHRDWNHQPDQVNFGGCFFFLHLL